MILDFTKYKEDFIIHYGVDKHQINSRTLAESLISLTNCIKTADSIINPGFEIEIVVDAIGIGSFKITTSLVRTSLSNVFNKNTISAVVIGLLTSFLYDLMKKDEKFEIIINTNEYILIKGKDRILLPREAEKYYESIKNNEIVKKETALVFKVLDKDRKIESIGFDFKKNSKEPDFKIPRESFSNIINSLNVEQIEEEKNDSTIRTRITIIRAILEKCNRKWQFIWNGIKISAPICDDTFYADFSNHKITIAPGDSLDVDLKIIQKKDSESGFFINSDYEVLRVYQHISGATQLEFGFK